MTNIFLDLSASRAVSAYGHSEDNEREWGPNLLFKGAQKMTSMTWVRFRHFLHKSHEYFFFRSIQREKKNILELLKRRQDAQEEELKQNLKLEQDVEMEKLRKVKNNLSFAFKS